MNQTQINETKSKKWCKRLPLLAAFLIPLLISVIICIDHEVYPFGERCLLQVDMYHQYCPFFTEFVDKLRSGESLMYSWTIGLGADFVSLFAYYLASPLNWFLLLCPKGYVIEFMSILMILRISLCGLTFAYYLKKHFHTNHPAIAVFGTAYALSAFMAAYAWNVMWTDCLVLAPLIILGVEQLVKEKKAALYYVTLATAILSNYYISIMICISCALFSDPFIGAEGRKNRGMCTVCMVFPSGGWNRCSVADPGSDYFRGERLAGDFFSKCGGMVF